MSAFSRALPLALAAALSLCAQPRSRARDLGIPFDGQPGRFNAITDVAGVEVGHSTIIQGDGPLPVGKGPVRTGVTAVLPRGRGGVMDPVFAGWFPLNGNGEITGTAWLEESGFLEGPVLITNTHSVGVVRDAVIEWQIRRGLRDPARGWFALPVVAETYDGYLNDINGFHVRPQHAFQALDSARGEAVAEGSVGGGTGMICHEFKGGIGASSRIAGPYTVGVLVQCNYGRRSQLRVAGLPVGREITEGSWRGTEQGSIIILVATDAPLLPHQLKRLARRAAMGLARNGSVAGNSSGDLLLAFSTANPGAASAATLRMLPNENMDPLFEATIQATEEAIINAMAASDTMTGVNGRKVLGLPHNRLRDILKKYNRLTPAN
ncbi:MAG: P1 family peptidase [Acidimicrobiia bacterium]|nr:P1 family peptidase [Acidimicrobiia bacterium]